MATTTPTTEDFGLLYQQRQEATELGLPRGLNLEQTFLIMVVLSVFEPVVLILIGVGIVYTVKKLRQRQPDTILTSRANEHLGSRRNGSVKQLTKAATTHHSKNGIQKLANTNSFSKN